MLEAINLDVDKLGNMVSRTKKFILNVLGNIFASWKATMFLGVGINREILHDRKHNVSATMLNVF